MLILDCGGTLSDNTGRGAPNPTPYQSALEGAYAFLQSWIKVHGAGSLLVLSRVREVKADHWVVKFCVSMGLHPQQVLLVTNLCDKGPASFTWGCRAFVEDRSDAAWYIATANYHTLQQGVLFDTWKGKKQVADGISGLKKR